MSWNFLDVLDVVVDVLELFSSGSGSSSSDRESLNYDERLQKKESKKSRYFTEKVSAVALALSVFCFFIVLKILYPHTIIYKL